MSKIPKVSVITFVYVNQVNGRLPLLKECLESVRDQGYPNYEHIIIDDGCDYDLKPLIDEFPHTRLYTKLGTGILSSTYTFNLGHQLATGDFCIYLPSDDLHLPNALQGMADVLADDPTAVCAIGRAVYQSANGKTFNWSPNPELIDKKMVDGNHINGCAVMWRRSNKLLELLPPNYTGFCSDYDLFATMVKMGKVAYTDVEVVRYRHAADSTRNKTRSRIITSPRKEDGICFQFSRAARLEFVKIRIARPLDRMYRQSGPAALRLSLDDDGEKHSHVTRSVASRSWEEAHQTLSRMSPDYAQACSSLAEVRAGEIIEISSLCLSGIVLMHQFVTKLSFNVIHSSHHDDWIFDYCPMPAIANFQNKDGSTNDALNSFLGL